MGDCYEFPTKKTASEMEFGQCYNKLAAVFSKVLPTLTQFFEKRPLIVVF